jgi:hypothetical protein
MLNGALDLTTQDRAYAAIFNGLTLNGTVTIGSTAQGYQGTLGFNGTQTLAGTGTVVLASTDDLRNSVSVSQHGTTLTIGAGNREATPTMAQASTMIPGGAVALRAQPSVTTVVAGTAFTLTVTALDAAGNPAIDFTGLVHFTSTDPATMLPDDYTFTAADRGVHTFSLTLKTAGNRSVTVTSGMLTDTANLTVTPGATSKFLVSGFPSSITAGTAGMVTVVAQDAFGNATPGYLGTVHFTSSDAEAVLPGDYSFVAGDNGMHTFSGLMLETAATQSITATDATTLSITGSQSGIVVNPAPADHFQLVAPAGSTAGQAFDLTVAALDPFGNVDVNYTGTVTFSSSDPMAVLPADYTFSATDQGMVTFAGGVTLFLAGNQAIMATDVATGLLSGSATVAVTPAAADHFEVNAVMTSVAGQPFDITVIARDPYGNIDVNYQGTITFSSSDPAAVLPGNYTFAGTDQGMVTFAGGAILFLAGSQTITVIDVDTGQLMGTAGATVTPAPADHFLVTAPPTVMPGQPFDVMVTALDPYGNVDVNYQGTVHFSSMDPDPGVVLPADYTFTGDDQGVHTFAGGVTLQTPGTWDVTVTDLVGGQTGSASVMVLAGGGSPERRNDPGRGRWPAWADVSRTDGSARSVPAAASLPPASLPRAEEIEPAAAGVDRYFATVGHEYFRWVLHRPRRTEGDSLEEDGVMALPPILAGNGRGS